jgi:hypothetical protein
MAARIKSGLFTLSANAGGSAMTIDIERRPGQLGRTVGGVGTPAGANP